MAIGDYSLLADLFVYPDEAIAANTARVQEYLDLQYPTAGHHLETFSECVAQTTLHEMQEIFLRSFDVQAVTTLDIGYVLFGDDYKRGAMLVNLNQEHAKVGNPCYNELADHLPNVLRLVPLIEDDDFRAELVDRLLAPAMRKIIAEFDPERIVSKEKVYHKHHKTLIDNSKEHRTIYLKPLLALYELISADFTLTDDRPPEPSSDFLKNIGTEITLETEAANTNTAQSCSP
jgi:nitrate reductase assembly molybdenum cofactor insertion protein NarJ